MSRHNSKSGLFLMEMIIVILFFSISAAICISIFATARITADHSNDLNNAAVRATSMAEVYKSSKGDLYTAAAKLRTLAGDDVMSVGNPGKDGMQMTVVFDDMTMTLEKSDGGLAHIIVESGEPSYSSKADENGMAEIFSMDVRAREVGV